MLDGDLNQAKPKQVGYLVISHFSTLYTNNDDDSEIH